MVGWVLRQEDARAQSVQAAPKACMQPAELQRIGCKRALQEGSNDLPSAPVCTAITAIPAALSSYANSMQTKLKHKSKLKSKLISCIIVCSIWMASWCSYVQLCATHLGQKRSTTPITQGCHILILISYWERVQSVLCSSWPDAEILLYAAGERSQSFWIAFKVL